MNFIALLPDCLFHWQWNIWWIDMWKIDMHSRETRIRVCSVPCDGRDNANPNGNIDDNINNNNGDKYRGIVPQPIHAFQIMRPSCSLGTYCPSTSKCEDSCASLGGSNFSCSAPSVFCFHSETCVPQSVPDPVSLLKRLCLRASLVRTLFTCINV